MSNQQHHGLATFGSQARREEDEESMSSFDHPPVSNNQPNIATLLYTYIRRDDADAFDGSVQDLHIQTVNTLNNLQGEVFNGLSK